MILIKWLYGILLDKIDLNLYLKNIIKMLMVFYYYLMLLVNKLLIMFQIGWKDVKENFNKNINSEYGQESENALYLIGNKIDLPNIVISKEQTETEAKSRGMKYFEISCKINMNIPEVMNRMIMECHMKANHIKNIKNIFILYDDKYPSNNNKIGGCFGDREKK